MTQQLYHFAHNMHELRSGYQNAVQNMAQARKHDLTPDFREPLDEEHAAFFAAIQGGAVPNLVQPAEAKEALRIGVLAAAARVGVIS